MIRKVKQTDVEDLQHLARLCMEHAIYERCALPAAPDLAALHAALSGARPKLHAWVAADRHGVVGFASGSLGYSTWHARPQFNLDCVFLQQSARGQGLGTKLMGAVHAFAAHRQCGHMEWVTPVWNVRAIAFYRQLGAQEQPRSRFRATL